MNRLNLYHKLHSESKNCLSEKKSSYLYLTERHIQILWLEQKYLKDLYTFCQKKIEIISPGIWNSGAGPDFKKAHLIIEGSHFIGDIEIHLTDHGWRDHDHHLDSNYDQVILHISFWNTFQPSSLLTSKGKKIFQSYLENNLTIPIEKITEVIDTELYPYSRISGSGQCSDKLFLKLSRESLNSFFKDASDWRLSKKREHINSRIKSDGQFCGSGIAMALGYKKNSDIFLSLFLDALEENVNSFQDLLVYFLGKCGFFALNYQKTWEESETYQKLLKQHLGNETSQKFKLSLFQIRPLNHPIRRLVYLAYFISSQSYKDIESKIYHFWKSNWKTLKNKKAINHFITTLTNFIPDFEDIYWNQHFTFEKVESKRKLPLIGKSLKLEIIINTFLPYIDSIIEENNEEKNHFDSLFSAFKSSKSHKFYYLKHRFFGRSELGKLLNQADYVQGAFQLHYDFCVHYESSCEGCPFVQKYKEIYLSRLIE